MLVDGVHKAQRSTLNFKFFIFSSIQLCSKTSRAQEKHRKKNQISLGERKESKLSADVSAAKRDQMKSEYEGRQGCVYKQ